MLFCFSQKETPNRDEKNLFFCVTGLHDLFICLSFVFALVIGAIS
jgi:hypothetical protein